MSALLSTFGIDWQLLIAQSVNFALLAVALTWFLYKPVLKMVRDRQQVIAKGVADAEESARQLAHAGTETEGRLRTADETADKIVADARHAASLEKARLLKEAEERAALVAADAKARADETMVRARRESERDIARAAMLAAKKILADRHD